MASLKASFPAEEKGKPKVKAKAKASLRERLSEHVLALSCETRDVHDVENEVIGLKNARIHQTPEVELTTKRQQCSVV